MEYFETKKLVKFLEKYEKFSHISFDDPPTRYVKIK